MISHQSSLFQARRLWRNLSSRRRSQIILLVPLIVLSSIAEALSIGAVLPFLGILTSPVRTFNHEFARPIVQKLNLQGPHDLLMPLTLAFIFTVMFAALTRVALLWASTKLSMRIATDLTVQVYERTLYQPYSAHIKRNSSEILSGLGKTSGLAHVIVKPAIQIVSGMIILSATIIMLLYVQPTIAIGVFLGFGFIYYMIVNFSKRLTASNSHTVASKQYIVTKVTQEGLGGIRDMIIDGSQPVFINAYKEALLPMQAASASSQIIGGAPRFVVEALGMTLIALVAFSVVSVDGAVSRTTDVAIPLLGAFALGAQKLLPLLQQIYSSWIILKSNHSNVRDALELLEQPMPEAHVSKHSSPIEFKKSVRLENIWFSYTERSNWVLKDLSFNIPRGGRVGVIGITGSGKSTLVDILVGLLEPTKGRLIVDNEVINSRNVLTWQKHIAHVPQQIFLADMSVAENIAFGVTPDKIDLQRVMQAACAAQISETIEGWPERYSTQVGERGVRLSGGQRQRLGIARALYKRADVLIFDEPTSALDYDTESAIMQTIKALDHDVTVIIIAHRQTTLAGCDFIIELHGGSIKFMGNYEDVVKYGE